MFCVDCLEGAWCEHDKPEEFNIDHGSQVTNGVFNDVLKREAIAISLYGRDRAYGNTFVERLLRSVKHEDVYLNCYATMGELLIGQAQSEQTGGSWKAKRDIFFASSGDNRDIGKGQTRMGCNADQGHLHRRDHTAAIRIVENCAGSGVVDDAIICIMTTDHAST